MDNLRQYINYANIAGLLIFIIGQVLHMAVLTWIGIGIIVLASIWTIIHWKENDNVTNWMSVIFVAYVLLRTLGVI